MHRQRAELVDRRDQRRRDARAGDLLDHEHGRERVGTGAAVLLGHVRGVEVRGQQRGRAPPAGSGPPRRPRPRTARSWRRRPRGRPRGWPGAPRRGRRAGSRSCRDSRTSSILEERVYGVVMATPPTHGPVLAGPRDRRLDARRPRPGRSSACRATRRGRRTRSPACCRSAASGSSRSTRRGPTGAGRAGVRHAGRRARSPSTSSTSSAARDAAGEFADQAVEVGAGGVWFQLGVIDEDAFARTLAAGVPMVMDTCPAIEWRKR